jgi:hypothetical protein
MSSTAPFTEHGLLLRLCCVLQALEQLMVVQEESSCVARMCLAAFGGLNLRYEQRSVQCKPAYCDPLPTQADDGC